MSSKRKKIKRTHISDDDIHNDDIPVPEKENEGVEITNENTSEKESPDENKIVKTEKTPESDNENETDNSSADCTASGTASDNQYSSKTDDAASENSEADGEGKNSPDITDAEQAAQSQPGKKNRTADIVLKWVQNILIAVCSVVFIICIYMLIQNLSEKARGNDIYNDAGNMFTPVIPGDDASSASRGGAQPYLLKSTAGNSLLTLYDRLISSNGSASENEITGDYAAQLELMRQSLSELIAVNSDVCGWIYVPGTKINYPFVKGTDNLYYLDRDYTKQYLAVGTIFMDYENDRDITKNMNTVMYGHNVYNGAMFHDLEKFKNQEFFNENKLYIYTMDGIYIYTPFSIYATKEYYQYFQVQFINEEEFLTFAKNMKANSMCKSDLTFEPGDKMLTLSTCTNNIEGDGRYAFHLKLTEIITDKQENTNETGS